MLYTMGYGNWKSAVRIDGMISALKGVGIRLLIDIRHSPCASDPTGRSMYGPRPWTLEREGGLLSRLEEEGIRYAWVGELGNPQKNDPAMTILNWHLSDTDRDWPVKRGMKILERLFDEFQTVCLLCGCEKYEECHRRVIAEAFGKYKQALRVCDLGSKGAVEVFRN